MHTLLLGVMVHPYKSQLLGWQKSGGL
jgi:hypothetical protein